MKKLFVCFIAFFVSTLPVKATIPPNLLISLSASIINDIEVITYAANNTVYYVSGDVLEALKAGANDTCLEYAMKDDKDQEKTQIIKFHELLLSQCRQKITSRAAELEEHHNVVLAKALKAMNRLSLAGKMPLTKENEYKLCAVTLTGVEYILDQLRPKQTYSYTINQDIDACINAVQISSGTSECPISPAVESEQIIANIKNMNKSYRNQTITFDKRPEINPNQVLVFNGTVMIVCDNGKPVHIIKPSFSGYAECRDAQYQSYPNVGSTPDGIYLAKHDGLEKHDDMKSWGGYRIPLIPSKQTKTYGRENMYLHGTSDPNKRRSGGCISLGVAIDEFITSDWFQTKARDLLIIVKTN